MEQVFPVSFILGILVMGVVTLGSCFAVAIYVATNLVSPKKRTRVRH